MKKRNPKSLMLNKRSISKIDFNKLDQVKGGGHTHVWVCETTIWKTR